MKLIRTNPQHRSENHNVMGKYRLVNDFHNGKINHTSINPVIKQNGKDIPANDKRSDQGISFDCLHDLEELIVEKMVDDITNNIKAPLESQEHEGICNLVPEIQIQALDFETYSDLVRLSLNERDVYPRETTWLGVLVEQISLFIDRSVDTPLMNTNMEEFCFYAEAFDKA